MRGPECPVAGVIRVELLRPAVRRLMVRWQVVHRLAVRWPGVGWRVVRWLAVHRLSVRWPIVRRLARHRFRGIGMFTLLSRRG